MKLITILILMIVITKPVFAQKVFEDSIRIILNSKTKGKDKNLTYINYVKSNYKSLDSLGKIELVNRSIEIGATVNKKYQAIGMYLLGDTYFTLKNREQAFESYLKAYEFAEQFEDTFTIINATQNLAYFYKQWGDQENAMKYSLIALDMSEKKKVPRGISINAMNVGHALKSLQRYSDALKYYRLSYVNALADKNPTMIPNSLISIGNVYSALKIKDSALYYYRKAEIVTINFSQKGDKTTLGQSYQNIGELFLEFQELDSSKVYIEKSLSVYRELLQIKPSLIINNIAYSQVALAKVLGLKKEYIASIDTALAALGIAKKNNLRKLIQEAFLTLSDCYWNLDSLDKALHYSESAYDLLDSLKNEDAVNTANTLEIKFRVNKKERDNLLLKLENETEKNSILKLSVVKDLALNHAFRDSLGMTVVNARNKRTSDSLKISSLEKNKISLENEKNKNALEDWNKYAIIFAFVVLIIISGFILKNSLSNLKIAKLQKDVLANEIKSLNAKLLVRQLQMNPHDISELLSTAIIYVEQGGKKDAINYLEDLNTLVRSKLKNSLTPRIKLSGELKNCKLLYELKRAAIPEMQFEIEFISNDEIEAEFILIPPDLIYPFVENAIIHGISPMMNRTNALVKIRIEQKKDLLLIEVIDNGTGYRQENKISTKKDSGKFAVENTRLRIDAFNQENNLVDSKFSVADFHPTETDKGTILSYQIALIEDYKV